MQKFCTERLALKEFTSESKQELSEVLFLDPDVMQWFWTGGLMSQEEQQHFLEEHSFQGESFGLGALYTLKDDELIGMAGILPCDDIATGQFEIGFVLKKSAWKKGFASEIGHKQIEFAFEQMKLKKIHALVHPQNHASQKTIQKLGFSFEKEVDSERGPRQVFVRFKE